jgi:hypothetical protein
MTPLWPEDELPDGGRCQHCGAHRTLELQILSPLWHFMEETLRWYEDNPALKPGNVDAKVLQHPTWDWEAVAVLTCEANCMAGGQQWFVAEEAAAGFNLMHREGPNLQRLMQLSAFIAEGAPVSDIDDAIVDNDTAVAEMAGMNSATSETGG